MTCPFENGPSAFADARREKENKYAPLVEELKKKYGTVRVDAVVVGSLGSWDPLNDKVLLRICSKQYLHLMRKLIVSGTLRASRNIYTELSTGVWQEDGDFPINQGAPDQDQAEVQVENNPEPSAGQPHDLCHQLNGLRHQPNSGDQPNDLRHQLTTKRRRNATGSKQVQQTSRSSRPSPQLQSSVVVPDNSSLREPPIHNSQVPGLSTMADVCSRPAPAVNRPKQPSLPSLPAANRPKEPSLRTFRFKRCPAINRPPPSPGAIQQG